MQMMMLLHIYQHSQTVACTICQQAGTEYFWPTGSGVWSAFIDICLIGSSYTPGSA